MRIPNVLVPLEAAVRNHSFGSNRKQNPDQAEGFQMLCTGPMQTFIKKLQLNHLCAQFQSKNTRKTLNERAERSHHLTDQRIFALMPYRVSYKTLLQQK